MAENSIREQLIEAVKAQVETLTSIVTVKRIQPTFNDLSTMSGPQLPLIAIVGQMPVPIQKIFRRTAGGVEKFRSKLPVDVFCYAMDNDTPDTLTSDLADDIWRVLHADQTWGSLAIATEVIPELKVGRVAPFIMFKMLCEIEYIHSGGGI